MGDHSPESLNHVLFYTLSQHFGTRRVQEHVQMHLEDFRFVRKADSTDIHYVEWMKGLTKTRQGGLVKSRRQVPQRVFPTGTERYTVHMLEKLISVRPAESLLNSPLYLRSLRKPRPTLWYSMQPVGETKIKQFMKTIGMKADW